MANKPVLMQWGLVTFELFPLNFHELDHPTQTDWAKKEIAGAATYREWTGEGDEELHVRGRLFPHNDRLSGKTKPTNPPYLPNVAQIELVETMRREGIAALMVRGDGTVMGWFVIERLVRMHTSVGPYGVGKVVNFEALFARVPVPASGESEFSVLWQAVM